MTDWKRLAEARGLEIPPEQIDRIKAPLDGLEAAFRPLVAKLPFSTEPALIYFCPPEGKSE